MAQKWLTIPLALIAGLILVFLIAFFISQPEVSDAGPQDFVDVDGDEYLDLDYISPDEEGIGEFDESQITVDFEVAESVDECNSKEGLEKDDCLAIYSIFHNDSQGCEATEDQSLRDDCFAQIAYMQKDATLCEKVKVGLPECYTSIAIETNQASLCDKGKSEKDACLKAVASGNFSDCADGFERRFCNDAIVANDPAICENITDYSQICYYSIATETGSVSLCSKSGPSRDTCIFKVATTTNNAAICEQLTDSRDNCVAWVALNTNNRQLCFQSGAEAQSCLDDLDYFYS
ncbi:MAG: hypothetical protein ABIH20_01355 [Candidatus Diapherotrites archaeon]